MKSPREHAKALLAKAENDLIAATATLATGKALDTVCFHAQQAAEKSLKALLALKDVPYPFRHDLGELIESVKLHYPLDAALEAAVLTLAPYAVEVRYDELMSPPPEEARTALDNARKTHALAAKILGSST